MSSLAVFLMYASGLGVTMGAHRLWSHRSYKAKLPLRVFLLWLHTLAGQVNSICYNGRLLGLMSKKITMKLDLF